MDLAAAMTASECMQELDLAQITSKPFHITYVSPEFRLLILTTTSASNAISGDGIDEGISWLANQLSKKSRK